MESSTLAQDSVSTSAKATAELRPVAAKAFPSSEFLFTDSLEKNVRPLGPFSFLISLLWA